MFEFDNLDLLFKNLFGDSQYSSVMDSEFRYPVDITTTSNQLKIDIAVVGANDDDISITTDGDVINVKYTNPKTSESGEKEAESVKWLHKGITRRAFNVSWRISNKYDLKQLTAELSKGLLTITIPVAPDRIPEKIVINKK